MNLFLGNLGFGELFFIIIILSILIAWIWTLIRIIQSDFKNPNDKLMWVIIVVGLGFLGAIIYFIFGEKNRIRKNY